MSTATRWNVSFRSELLLDLDRRGHSLLRCLHFDWPFAAGVGRIRIHDAARRRLGSIAIRHLPMVPIERRLFEALSESVALCQRALARRTFRRLQDGRSSFIVAAAAGDMLILFVMGVMHLGWMAAIGALILIEKLVPACKWISHTIGAVFIVVGAIVMIFPDVLHRLSSQVAF